MQGICFITIQRKALTSLFNLPIDKRMVAWKDFRQQLETVPEPLVSVAELYSRAPRTKIYSDPYDRTTWPTAWELIEENIYCPLNQLLGVAFTLRLTNRFQEWTPTIAITVDKITKSVYYILYCNDMVYGYEEDAWIEVARLPKSLSIMKIYNLDSNH